jgi:dimethylamine monooxygenase subunit C
LHRINPSRPVYSALEPDPCAKTHLIVAEGEGASAVTDLFSKADSAFAERATLLYVANSSGGDASVERLERLNAKVFRLLADVVWPLRGLAQFLESATMGTVIYVAGTQGFIGEVALLAGTYGVGLDSLRMEHRGSVAKRVRCVHCKSIEAQVVTATVICSQCKVRLVVRDHYSHRLNAFMGVSIDAENLFAEPHCRKPVP